MAALRHEHTAARREALQLLYTGELTAFRLISSLTATRPNSCSFPSVRRA